MTRTIMTHGMRVECHYAECCCAVCRVFIIVILSVIMLRFVMLIVAMLSVVMLNVIIPNVIMLNVIILSVVMLSVVPPEINTFAYFCRNELRRIRIFKNINIIFQDLNISKLIHLAGCGQIGSPNFS
jgi:hypothetical protein